MESRSNFFTNGRWLSWRLWLNKKKQLCLFNFHYIPVKERFRNAFLIDMKKGWQTVQRELFRGFCPKLKDQIKDLQMRT